MVASQERAELRQAGTSLAVQTREPRSRRRIEYPDRDVWVQMQLSREVERVAGIVPDRVRQPGDNQRAGELRPLQAPREI